MKVVLGPGCDRDWLHSLNPWALSTLASIYRQGKHLRDRTNHGDDMRWQQAGCKTRFSGYRQWRRTSRREGHERVLIIRRDWNGFECVGIRRQTAWVIDPETGEMTQAPEAWIPVSRWYVGNGISANFVKAMYEEPRP